MGHAEQKRDPEDEGWMDMQSGRETLTKGGMDIQNSRKILKTKGGWDMQRGFPMKIAFSTEHKHKDM